ncbi:hypothetical protein SISNIDRAFT_469447 [Sistotremastrum niveocremeum HHB9708]|uniref:Uncharacterized protein n=1 Tax=Sistotremastrum niveocremeum HHB9708 TaxID=1314777 RepID=A0A164Q8I2_9AGAM|nr:hypothetical protein SISNIDRAFT_469447 [Sistotremastrum niveocremeum HHB9708]
MNSIVDPETVNTTQDATVPAVFEGKCVSNEEIGQAVENLMTRLSDVKASFLRKVEDHNTALKNELNSTEADCRRNVQSIKSEMSTMDGTLRSQISETQSELMAVADRIPSLDDVIVEGTSEELRVTCHQVEQRVESLRTTHQNCVRTQIRSKKLQQKDNISNRPEVLQTAHQSDALVLELSREVARQIRPMLATLDVSQLRSEILHRIECLEVNSMQSRIQQDIQNTSTDTFRAIQGILSRLDVSITSLSSPLCPGVPRGHYAIPPSVATPSHT